MDKCIVGASIDVEINCYQLMDKCIVGASIDVEINCYQLIE